MEASCSSGESGWLHLYTSGFLVCVKLLMLRNLVAEDNARSRPHSFLNEALGHEVSRSSPLGSHQASVKGLRGPRGLKSLENALREKTVSPSLLGLLVEHISS